MMRISAKHLTAPKGKKVQMSAAPYRGAPIRTNPAPDFETDFTGEKNMTDEREKLLSAATYQVRLEIERQGLIVERRGAAVWLHGNGINILTAGLGILALSDLKETQ